MNNHRENDFEKQAQKILSYLKRDIRYDRGHIPRPFFFEFTGSPSSGKTTCITESDKFLRRQGFRVWRPQEGAEVIRHIERTTPLYNIRTGIYALTLLMDESVGNKYDVVIFDRCVFDAYCWMMYWEEKEKLTEEEQRMIQCFFLFRLWVDKIDRCYFMLCDPKTAMERELRIALSQKLGETTNPKTIETLVNRYKTAYETLSPKHGQIKLIDTTAADEKEMVEMIANDMLAAMEEKISEKKGDYK